MEWIKNMSLKKSLFTLTFVNLLLAVILSAVVFWSCTKLSAALDPSDVQIVVGADAITKNRISRANSRNSRSRECAGGFTILLTDSILHCRFDINCIAVLSLETERAACYSHGWSKPHDGE